MTRDVLIVAAAALLIAGDVAPPTRNDPKIAARLEAIRTKHQFPALGGAIVTSHGLVGLAITGVRRMGSDVAATPDDLWHLGSDTKAMTAVVIGKLVEARKLTWDTTIAAALPAETASAPEAFRSITLLQLLSHRAGLVGDIDWAKADAAASTPRARRLAALRTIGSTPLASAPGSTYAYSNAGYVVAATMAEAVADHSWDQMIQDVVFTPLGMTSCGFGGLGTPGQIDQPWPSSGQWPPGGEERAGHRQPSRDGSGRHRALLARGLGEVHRGSACRSERTGWSAESRDLCRHAQTAVRRRLRVRMARGRSPRAAAPCSRTAVATR